MSLFGKNQQDGQPGEDGPIEPTGPVRTPEPRADTPERKQPQPGHAPTAGHGGKEMANVGQSIAIKGDATQVAAILRRKLADEGRPP